MHSQTCIMYVTCFIRSLNFLRINEKSSPTGPAASASASAAAADRTLLRSWACVQ